MAPGRSGITRLRVGRLTKAHGLKGALKVELFTDEPERRFVPGASFILQVPPESEWHGRSLELRELRYYNGHPVGFFEGVDDRTAAETLAKAILWVDQDEAEELEPDTWYDHQLIGLDVVIDETVVGRVSRVDHLPAQDLIVVETEAGEVLVPFVSQIVPSVDLATRRVVMTPPTGLFDPEAADVARSEPGEGASRAEAEGADATGGADDAERPADGTRLDDGAER